MTPKEKAKELVDKFENYCDVDDPNGILDWQDCLKQNAKNCALICINEMIRICYDHNMASYYGEVKLEIEKL